MRVFIRDKRDFPEQMRGGTFQSHLETMFDMLVAGTRMRAMLADFTELPRTHKDLSLDYRRYQIHTSEFCGIAKSTARGWRRCVRCQSAAVYKANRVGPYAGTCHMGLNEIVYPLKHVNKLIGVIFAGQVHFDGKKRLPMAVLRRKASRAGINWPNLRRASGKIPHIDAEAVDKVMRQVEVAGKFIQAYVQGMRNRSKLWRLRRRPMLPEASPITGRARNRWLANQGADIARNEYRKSLTTPEVASRLGASLSVFCHAFKGEIGQPFRMYLLRIRIEAAKQLLRKPGARITDVALESGFGDFSYFSRIFARIVGHSPLKYRNMVISSRVKRLPQTKSNY